MIEVNPRVKDALRSGMYRKNYRINVLNDDGTTDFTLNNTELVSESVKIDERMCSGDTLKFGLCEGSSIEFQYFNHDNINHPNIRGRRIQVFVDVQYRDADGELDWEAIPLGFFDVQECSTQFSTGIMKVVGYNKLKSAYLDNKANDQIVEIVQTGVAGSSGNMEIGLILSELLNGYTINPDLETVGYSIFRNNVGGSTYYQYYVRTENGGYLDELIGYKYTETEIKIDNYDSTKIYRLWINTGKIFEIISQYVPNDYWDEYISETDPNYSDDVFGFDYMFDYDNRNMNVAIMIYGVLGIYIGGENKDKYSVYTTWLTNFISQNDHFDIQIPVLWKKIEWDHNLPVPLYTITPEEEAYCKAIAEEIVLNSDCFRIEVDTSTGMEAVSVSVADAEALPDVTLRELQSAVFETAAEFGQLSRTTDLFEGVTLSRERLFPADDLYPSDTLYPQSVSESTFKSMYEKLWTDSVGEQTFRKLYITYKGLDDQQREKEFVLERTVNADGTTDYYCDDNWLFKNLIWTEQQVGDYADAMVLKMRGIKWFPFEMWSAGLPYIEVGDELEIISKDGTYTSYVLQRSLNGIQNLKDTYINGSLDIF